MGTISDKLMRIINTKEDIRQALISKGYDVPTSIPFKEYAKMISDLPCRVDSFLDIEGIVARYSALDLTNEQMKENPVWVDKTGNGHDLQMKNFAWGGMSGVGGYSDNFSSDSWKKPSDRSDITWTSSSFNITRVMNTGVQIYYFSAWEESESVIPEKRIIVKGLEDGQVLRYMNVGNRIIEISQDGIYTIPSFTFKGANSYHGYSLAKKQESCNVTVEQLPLYPGALVFDGVDDWAGCDNLPLLPKEKGYSIIALRNWITRYDATQYKRPLISNLDTNDEGAFLIEYRKDENVNDVTGSYNSFTDVYIDDNNPITWQTSSSYNGQIIKKGTSKSTNKLCICKTYFGQLSNYANAAIWELIILDHDATEEELTKIKDYFVKTYPWLFPDQAWTVTGKTNEDEDRATIANITGNSNDLVLSNFGFVEGSGYNEEGEYAGYLVTDGVDDKVVSAESIAFTDTWTIITDTVFLGKVSVASGILASNIFTVYNYQGSGTIAVTMGKGGSSLGVITSSIKAFSLDGTIYDAEWNEYHVEIGTIRALERLLKIGTSRNETSYFCQLAFKFLGIYNNQILSKDDCIKAYNYLQTLKAK